MRDGQRLGGTGGSGLLWGRPLDVVQDGQGRFWVFDAKAEPVVFDAAGRFVAKVGRKGPGPRELGDHIGALALPGDSMLLLDDRVRAVVVAPDLSVTRVMTARHLLRPAVVIQWPDSVVLTGPLGTEGSAGYPLHLAGFTAFNIRILRSFGPQVSRPRGFTYPLEMFQAVAPAGNGDLWASPVLEYSLRRMSSSGNDRQILKREASWFVGRSKAWLGNPDSPPPPRLLGIRHDRDGLLWIFGQVASPRWKQAWARIPSGVREVPGTLIDREYFFDLLVEVVDPATERVLARRRLSWDAVALPAAAPTVARYEEGPDGEPSVRIVELWLAGR
jgi:hypothetical protein